MRRDMTHKGYAPTDNFTETEITTGATPVSVELNRTTKGTYTWTLKGYYEIGAFDTAEGRDRVLDGLLHMDTLLRKNFNAAAEANALRGISS